MMRMSPAAGAATVALQGIHVYLHRRDMSRAACGGTVDNNARHGAISLLTIGSCCFERR
jgi:hypothetical protein